eukprot:TRINITY_DN48203_c0_g1_i1.p1 TRINITY_DN48203_c0_g1~~TRINITY_DN48203_c0_g1_i1.p1  ORF type:complete len:520 (-),score=71.73 TRINITY_DN48203_c0_g1_i1:103-1662(-)
MGNATCCTCASILPDGVAPPGISSLGSVKSVVSVNKSCAALTSPCLTAHKDIFSLLGAFQEDGVEFCSVQIFRETLSAGVGDHHGLLYSYTFFGLPAFLRVDWGQDGLSFDVAEGDTAEHALRRKDCGLAAASLKQQILEVSKRTYCLIRWNCQHFCIHLFDKAGGNWDLNAQLIGLQEMEVIFSSVCIHEKEPTATETQEGGYSGQSKIMQGIVYWYADPDTGEVRGVKVEWASTGLAFARVQCSNASARDCKMPTSVPRQGSVTATYVDATDSIGKVIIWRPCCMKPERILKNLRDVEGQVFEEVEWNCSHFAKYMFSRTFFRGGRRVLLDHLGDLAEHNVSLRDIQEVTIDDLDFLVQSVSLVDLLVMRELENDGPPFFDGSGSTLGDRAISKQRHAMVYVYEHLDRRVFLHLGLDVATNFVWFHEADRLLPGSRQIRKRVNQIRRRHATIVARIGARQLLEQIVELREEEGGIDRSETWDSERFCATLFAKVPGKEQLAPTGILASESSPRSNSA